MVGAQILQDLRDCFVSLEKLHNEGREKQYIFDYYDIHFFLDDKAYNILAQIANSVSRGLSELTRLPSIIFVFLDDLIFTSGEIFLPSEVEVQLRWIFTQVDDDIKTRKKAMPHKAVRALEPKIYLVKSLPRYNFGRTKMPFSEFIYRQERYNTLLYQIGRCFGYDVMDITSINHNDLLCFDEGGNGRQLSNRGKYRFWRELCQHVADSDRQKDKENRKRILQDELKQRERDRSFYNRNNNSYY